MWSIHCSQCKDVLGYVTQEPKAGEMIYYEEFFHVDFSPAESRHHLPFCRNCGGFLFKDIPVCLQDCEKVVDLFNRY